MNKDLIDALDGLWGVCDNLYAVCAEVVDSRDARLEMAGEALSKAQYAIERLTQELETKK